MAFTRRILSKQELNFFIASYKLQSKLTNVKAGER